MTHAPTDIAGWHESADIITDGGHKPCAERIIAHECGATLKLFSGWAPVESEMQWWWRLEWKGQMAERAASPDFYKKVANLVPLAWAQQKMFDWKRLP